MTHKTYFISDLHLLSSRSHGDRHFDTMESLAALADRFVLGGDIFDFRWSLIRSTDWAVETAASWLCRFCKLCPRCDVHYVLGNHDYYQPFIDRLEHEAREHANLNWHPYFYRHQQNVFLHGDVIDRDMNTAQFIERRRQWLDHSRKGPVMNTLYDLAVWARFHVPMPYLARPKKTVARRLTSYLRENGQGYDDGVRHVYFGHTHMPLSGYEYEGLTFHNSGATIKGVRFQILETLPEIPKPQPETEELLER